MVISYIVILCISAALAAFTARRITMRLSAMTSAVAPRAGLFTALSAIGFLIIVAMPPLVVAGALLMLALLGWGPRLHASAISYLAVPLVACGLGITTLMLSPLWGSLPASLGYGVAIALWAAFSACGRYLPQAPTLSHASIAAMVLPLATAPLYSSAPSYLGLDGALLIAPLLGAGLAARRLIALDVLYLAPAAYLIGWMMLNCLAHASYLAPALSLAAFGGALLFRFLQPPTPFAHAPAL